MYLQQVQFDHWVQSRQLSIKQQSLIMAFMHTTWAAVNFKPEKTSRLNGIQTHDFRDTCPLLYQLNYQHNYP